MLKLFKKEKKNNKGFTLVELVVVVAILAILVGLLAPQYTKYVERSRKAADAANLDNLVKAVEVAVADTTYSDLIPETGNVEITIKITQTGTSVTSSPDKNTTISNALTEYAGASWNKTALKSKAWKLSDNTTVAIQAKLTISNLGSVSVEYDPADVKTTETNK